MALEERVSSQCRFWMNLDEGMMRSRLEAMEGFVRWTLLRGQIGALDGMVMLLENGVMAGFWRDAGGAMFRPGEGMHFEPGPGELYGMQLDIPVVVEQEGVTLRHRILKQLDAITAKEYAVVLIQIAARNKPEVLDLSGKGLDELPAEIGMLTELPALDLSKNRLTRLPAEIGRLAQLEELVVCENRLVELPAEIGQLGKLQILWLEGNKLETLPAEIGGLAELRHLEIQNNALATLPPEIGKLQNLRRLWLQNNALKALPAELSDLKNLKDWVPNGKSLPPRFPLALDAHGNPLSFPPPDVVRKGSQAVREFLAAYRASRNCPFTVWLVENDSNVYADQNERRSLLGYYQDGAAAVEASETVIDEYLRTLPIGTAEELYQSYARRGQEPRIHLDRAAGTMDAPTFSAREYARRRCEEIAAERESERARQATVDNGNPLSDPPPNAVAHGSQAIPSYLGAPEPFYIVWVVENSGLPNMKPNKQARELGRFRDYASAAAAGYKVIDDYLAGLVYVTADELLDACRRFGPEPWIESNFACVFDPFRYASRRCKEIAAERARM